MKYLLQNVLFRCMLIKMEKSRKVGAQSHPADDSWSEGELQTKSKINWCQSSQINNTINNELVSLFLDLKLHARHWYNISNLLHCIPKFHLLASLLKLDKNSLTLTFMIIKVMTFMTLWPLWPLWLKIIERFLASEYRHLFFLLMEEDNEIK